MPDNNRRINTDGGINVNLNMPANNPVVTPPTRPEIENIEPVETPTLQAVEPTASFAVDLHINQVIAPLLSSPYIVKFRPINNWEGKNYGFDWLRIGDSGQWCDKQNGHHFIKKVGKYYVENTYTLDALDVPVGNQVITESTSIKMNINKTGRINLNGIARATIERLKVRVSGTGFAIYTETIMNLGSPAPPSPYSPSQSRIGDFKLVNVFADGNVGGDIPASFTGTDNGTSTPGRLEGSVSGNSDKEEIILRGALNGTTNDIGRYGNDANDFRYTRSIPAENRTNGPRNGEAFNCNFVAGVELYRKLLKKYFPIGYTLVWKAKELLDEPTGTPEEYELKRTKYIYSVPLLLMNVGDTIRVKIIPETSVQIGVTPLRIEFRESIAGENNFTIPHFTGNMNNGGEITITCNNAIDTFKYIDAFTVIDDPANPGQEIVSSTRCGSLRVHPNNVRRRLNILFVFIKVNISSFPTTGTMISNDEQEMNTNLYGRQAMLDFGYTETMTLDVPNIINNPDKQGESKNVTAELVGTDANGVHKFGSNLNDEFLHAFTNHLRADAAATGSNANRFDNHIKVFITKEGSLSAAGSTNFEKKTIILFDGRNKETFAHELGHAMGLPHTFTVKEIANSYIDGVDASSNAEFTYQGRMTENIMDYSHMKDDQYSGTQVGKRYAFYYWQIRQIWQYLNQLNGTAIPIPNLETSNDVVIGNDSNMRMFQSTARI